MIMGCCGLSGCGTDDYPTRVYFPEYESGYYKYAVQTKRDGTKKAYLLGLTESGLEQTALVYPEEIDGIPVEICLSTEKESSENVLAKFIYELLENEHNQTLLNIQPDNAG